MVSEEAYHISDEAKRNYKKYNLFGRREDLESRLLWTLDPSQKNFPCHDPLWMPECQCEIKATHISALFWCKKCKNIHFSTSINSIFRTRATASGTADTNIRWEREGHSSVLLVEKGYLEVRKTHNHDMRTEVSWDGSEKQLRDSQ